jgi:hypothetical protein
MMLGPCQVVAAGHVALLPGLREPRRRVNQFLLPDPPKDGGHGVVGREPVLGKNTGAERLTRHVVGYLIEAPLFIPGTTVVCFFETSKGRWICVVTLSISERLGGFPGFFCC